VVNNTGVKQVNKTFQHKDFQGSVEYDSTDNIYFGCIQNVDDLVTYEAESKTALKQAFIEAVEDYIETCQAIGKEVTFKRDYVKV
jgi:predicted HicB family RNase H-like nuclease